ncbi:MAG: lipase family protein [Verrucomicrobiota bacterium]
MTTYLKHYDGLEPQSAYHPETALSLAVLCRLAYEPSRTVKKAVSDELPFDRCEFFSVKKAKDIDTQCFVAGDATDIVVVFRGTDKINDWFSNFQAVRDPGPLTKTKAHEGFQDALFPSVIRLTNAIDTLFNNGQRIWVTGHSLGGALCSLYAAMMFEAGYHVHGIYTFASPRPGDAKLADALETRMSHGPHHRVVNENDVVPHVPPEPFFSHSGTRMILRDQDHDITSDGWRGVKRNIFERLMDFTGINSDLWNIKGNHVLDGDEGYIAQLRRQVERGSVPTKRAAKKAAKKRAAKKVPSRRSRRQRRI